MVVVTETLVNTLKAFENECSFHVSPGAYFMSWSAIDAPALDQAEVRPARGKRPPGQNRAGVAAVSWQRDQLEDQDHGGRDLAGSR